MVVEAKGSWQADLKVMPTSAPGGRLTDTATPKGQLCKAGTVLQTKLLGYDLWAPVINETRQHTIHHSTQQNKRRRRRLTVSPKIIVSSDNS